MLDLLRADVVDVGPCRRWLNSRRATSGTTPRVRRDRAGGGGLQLPRSGLRSFQRDRDRLMLQASRHPDGRASAGTWSRNEPSKRFETMVLRSADPAPCRPEKMIARAECAQGWEDNNGNIRPVKPKRNSPKRIDGVVSESWPMYTSHAAAGGKAAPAHPGAVRCRCKKRRKSVAHATVL